MRAPTRQAGSPVRRAPSANDRFKAGWSSRLAWSMTAAVAAHVVVLAFWPSWASQEPPADDAVDEPPMEWIFLRELPSAGRLTVAPAVAGGEGTDSTASEPATRAGTDGPEELAAFAGALRERLLRGGGPVPTISGPEPEPAVEEPPVASEEDSTTIGADASTAEVPELPDDGSVDLDRLSALRPELALSTASNWVLIRNPVEVDRYMRRISRRRDLEAGGEVSVSVTLWIDERGSVEWAEVSESSGRSELDEIALALFNEVAAFRPARNEGIRVPKSVIFTVHFPW